MIPLRQQNISWWCKLLCYFRADLGVCSMSFFPQSQMARVLLLSVIDEDQEKEYPNIKKIHTNINHLILQHPPHSSRFLSVIFHVPCLKFTQINLRCVNN